MSFANHYIDKHKIKTDIKSAVPANLGIAVIIPCYNEPGLPATLGNLLQTHSPSVHTEVLVVINNGAQADQQIKKQNLNTYEQCRQIKQKSRHITIHPLYYPTLPTKYAGAGLARKLGMDQAVDRFNFISKPGGILVSLDADTRVEKNYLTEIEKTFYESKNTIHGCNIHFEHPLQGSGYNQDVYDAIALYELRLRFYKNALRYTGFPYAYHTVGSCFAVRAETYVKQGGMSKRKGGEDFYFLNKIFPLGRFEEVRNTTVYPSPRPSERVPFGTGPSIRKHLTNTAPLQQYYNIVLFTQIKQLFDTVHALYKKEGPFIDSYMHQLHPEIRHFLNTSQFKEQMMEINNNVASAYSFKHRFFQYFNAFKVVKFLNETSRNQATRSYLVDEAQKLLSMLNIPASAEAEELLKTYRKIDKKEILSPPLQQ